MKPYIDCDQHMGLQILTAVQTVMTSNNAYPPSEFTKTNVFEIGKQLLFMENIDSIPEFSMATLKTIANTTELREKITRVLAPCCIIEGKRDQNNVIIPGTFNSNNIKCFLEIASELQVDTCYVKAFRLIADDKVSEVLNNMKRQHLESQLHRKIKADEDLEALLDAKPNPKLLSQFESLKDLPEDTFGYQFWRFYKENKYYFPGHEKAKHTELVTQHDTLHILHGYDTSYIGEMYNIIMCDILHTSSPYPLNWHILPYLFCWQLGFSDTSFAHNNTKSGIINKNELKRCWEAWIRGYNIKYNQYDKDFTFDFFINCKTSLVELRKELGIPPLESGSFKGRWELYTK